MKTIFQAILSSLSIFSVGVFAQSIGVCPEITITGPVGLTPPGDEMVFSVNVAKAPENLRYEWTVSAGKIETGQGTATIEIATTKEMNNSNVAATVRIKGLPPACADSAAATGTVFFRAYDPTPRDVFGPLAGDDVKARIQNFYIGLNNEPDARGTIVNYGSPAQIKARRKQIMIAVDFLKLDGRRVKFVDGPDRGKGIETILWHLPAGAPQPDI